MRNMTYIEIGDSITALFAPGAEWSLNRYNALRECQSGEMLRFRMVMWGKRSRTD